MLYATQSTLCDLLPLANGGLGGLWFLVFLIVGIWLLVRGVSSNMTKSRQRMQAGDRKRCRRCEMAQPGFAHYCRQCGERF